MVSLFTITIYRFNHPIEVKKRRREMLTNGAVAEGAAGDVGVVKDFEFARNELAIAQNARYHHDIPGTISLQQSFLVFSLIKSHKTFCYYTFDLFYCIVFCFVDILHSFYFISNIVVYFDS